MNLLLDSLSSPATLALFNSKRIITAKKIVNIALNESSKLIDEINTFLSENKIDVSDIENIIITNWPGWFTWVRTVTLIANTLAFRSNITLTPISYFDLYNTYPIVKCSSKRDVFIQKWVSSEIEIISNESCIEYLNSNNITQIYGDFEKYENTDIIILKVPDYKEIIKTIQFQKQKQIEALYIKKPNIS